MDIAEISAFPGRGGGGAGGGGGVGGAAGGGAGASPPRTAEFWTFERLVTSRDPNWTLARVEAAEA